MPVSKIIGANDQKHGTAVVWVGPGNNIISSEPYSTASGGLLPPRTVPVLSGMLETRFDDVLYPAQSGGGY